MRVIYENFEIFLSNGAPAGVLDGTYEASPNEGQQPGSHALRKVNDDGTVDEEIVANVYIIGGATVA